MITYLTGFMGSGKSFTGRQVAAQVDAEFVDLDDEIEALAGRTIRNIFEQYGEEVFRDLETQVLRSFSEGNIVLATGGGAPCFHQNMDWMNEQGTTVFLDPSIEILLSRLREEQDHRPLLQQSREELETVITQKLADRRSCYQQARIQLSYDNADLDVVATLMDRLQSLRH